MIRSVSMSSSKSGMAFPLIDSILFIRGFGIGVDETNGTNVDLRRTTTEPDVRRGHTGTASRTSRKSVTQPSRAAAATIPGLLKSVRPVGLPCRPLKLRLLDEAQISRPTSLSGFMARHIEQPAPRHSK